MRRRAYLAAVGTSAATVAGCFGAGGTEGSEEYDIGMSSSRFKPATFAVAPGTTVVWRNTSKHAHTVTAYESGIPEEAEYFASGGFDSPEAAREGWKGTTAGAIQSGQTFEHEFTLPGTYDYFCIPHEATNMVGTIEVTEDATRTPKGTGTTAPNRSMTAESTTQ